MYNSYLKSFFGGGAVVTLLSLHVHVAAATFGAALDLGLSRRAITLHTFAPLLQPVLTVTIYILR